MGGRQLLKRSTQSEAGGIQGVRGGIGRSAVVEAVHTVWGGRHGRQEGDWEVHWAWHVKVSTRGVTKRGEGRPPIPEGLWACVGVRPSVGKNLKWRSQGLVVSR